jgi:AAA+ superfamily predicted ATPase
MVGGGMQGPRMVRDVFRLAKENAPAIIFIDEIDAIATARFDAQTGADREVQRILMELLNQMDGFDQTVNVKVRTRRPPSVRVKADEETAYLLKLSPDHRARRRVSEHEDCCVCESLGISGDRSRGHFATPADFPLHAL